MANQRCNVDDRIRHLSITVGVLTDQNGRTYSEEEIKKLLRYFYARVLTGGVNLANNQTALDNAIGMGLGMLSGAVSFQYAASDSSEAAAEIIWRAMSEARYLLLMPEKFREDLPDMEDMFDLVDEAFGDFPLEIVPNLDLSDQEVEPICRAERGEEQSTLFEEETDDSQST